MKNLILTWASNINEETWPQYRVYFNSVFLSKSQKEECVCLTDSLDNKYIDQIVENFNFTVYIVKTKTRKQFTERWLAYWNFLKDRAFNQVFISDSRDVFLQQNPFEYTKNKNFNVYLTEEGFLHHNSPFNMADQLQFQRNIQNNFETYVNWPVVNAGVVMGNHQNIIDLSLIMWSNCLPSQSTDQAILNFLSSKFKDDIRYKFCNPNKDCFCLTGEVYKEKFLDFDPNWIDNKITNQDKEIFFVFHQWDRTNFADSVLNLFYK